MAQRKVLLDSNSYFRLARSIHPLLHVEFGEDRCCLYVIKELRQEFDRSSRLQDKFHWVVEDEYVENRRRSISIPRKAAREIGITLSVIQGHAREEGLGVSIVDACALSTASVLEIEIVTDDADMLALARDFDIRAMKTLEIMQVMLECDHLTMAKIIATAGYWRWENDLPKDYEGDFRRLFQQEPP